MTEFDRAGRTLFDLRFGSGADSYRAYRFPWTGRPDDRPVLAIAHGNAYASWNGATEVAGWALLTGTSRTQLRRVRMLRKIGFETRAVLPSEGKYFAVEALDSQGRVLKRSLLHRRH